MFGLEPRKRERSHALATRASDPFRLFREEFDDLFDRFLEKWPLVAEGGERFPAAWGLDLEENDKEVTIRAEMPGFDAADFDIHVAGDLLTIQAEHKTEKGKEGEKKAERYAKISRSVTLPPGADTEKVEATYRNGILELKMPRKPEAAGRKIPVKT
jgi:HSP20 family protein